MKKCVLSLLLALFLLYLGLHAYVQIFWPKEKLIAQIQSIWGSQTQIPLRIKEIELNLMNGLILKDVRLELTQKQVQCRLTTPKLTLKQPLSFLFNSHSTPLIILQDPQIDILFNQENSTPSLKENLLSQPGSKKEEEMFAILAGFWSQMLKTTDIRLNNGQITWQHSQLSSNPQLKLTALYGEINATLDQQALKGSLRGYLPDKTAFTIDLQGEKHPEEWEFHYKLGSKTQSSELKGSLNGEALKIKSLIWEYEKNNQKARLYTRGQYNLNNNQIQLSNILNTDVALPTKLAQLAPLRELKGNIDCFFNIEGNPFIPAHCKISGHIESKNLEWKEYALPTQNIPFQYQSGLLFVKPEPFVLQDQIIELALDADFDRPKNQGQLHIKSQNIIWSQYIHGLPLEVNTNLLAVVHFSVPDTDNLFIAGRLTGKDIFFEETHPLIDQFNQAAHVNLYDIPDQNQLEINFTWKTGLLFLNALNLNSNRINLSAQGTVWNLSQMDLNVTTSKTPTSQEQGFHLTGPINQPRIKMLEPLLPTVKL